MNISYRMVAVAALLWAGNSAAVTTGEDEIPYVGAFYAHEFADSGRDSDGGNGFQAMFGMPFPWLGENNAIEASFYNIGRKRDIDGKKDYQAAIGLDLVHDFGLYGWGRESTGGWLPQFKPFVLGGLMAVRDDVRGNKQDTFGLDLGGGVAVPLPFFGAAARVEARVMGQANDESVPGEDLLIDYRIGLGVQVPLTPLFRERQVEVDEAKECELAVVDPATGRTDCGTDSDRDSVIDSLDQCPGTPVGTPVDAGGCASGTAMSPGGMDADRDGVPDNADRCPDTREGITVDMSGCAVQQSMSLKNVYFSNDSAEIAGEAKASLDEVAATLRGQPNLHVEIGGHTDAVGSQAYNLMLSQQRAESVRQYLIAQGIESARLTAQGYGEFKPQGTNEQPDERADNRRVEFKLIVG